MPAGDPTEIEGLLREVMAVLRRAYDLGRADALREAAAMLTSAAPPAAAPDRGRDAMVPPDAAPDRGALTPHRRTPVERKRRRGRADSMTEDRKAAAAALLAEGRLSGHRIAQEVGVSSSRLYRWLKEKKGDGKAS
jgi:hypothetical protein